MSHAPDQKELELLNHIHSLGIVSDNQIGPGDLSALLEHGRIGNDALTDAGKRARKNNAVKAK